MNNTKGDVSDAAVLPEQLCKLRQACKMFVFHFIPCPSCLSFSSFLSFHLLKKKKGRDNNRWAEDNILALV